MHILSNEPAERYSTFRLAANLDQVILVNRHEELAEIANETPPLVMGEGSNTIFLADQRRPLLRYLAAGKQIIAQTAQQVDLHVEAGHNWHELVTWVVNKGWWGLENLALIPGSVGAAPVQNIGAYGVEFADSCRYVDFYVWAEKQVRRIPAENCEFGYRDSIFKQTLSGQGVIIGVGLRLSCVAKPILRYPPLDQIPAESNIKDIYQRVILTRQSKLPDYRVLPNCGSFFKNPVIMVAHYELLKQQHPTIPGYTTVGGIKVPAAWLLDQLGLKGYILDGIGCYDLQPLVVVNHHANNSAALLHFVSVIRSRVYETFSILLEPEVRLLDANGQHYVKS